MEQSRRSKTRMEFGLFLLGGLIKFCNTFRGNVAERLRVYMFIKIEHLVQQIEAVCDQAQLMGVKWLKALMKVEAPVHHRLVNERNNNNNDDEDDDDNNNNINNNKYNSETEKVGVDSVESNWIRLHRNEPLTRFYHIDKSQLGDGAFGLVRKATNKKTDQVCAVKSIQKKSSTDAAKCQRERQIMKELDHPHIVQLYETFEDAKYFHIIMELCEGGDLMDKLESSVCELDAAKYMSQILSAVSYMHRNHIMHRDLKPENVMLETKAQGSPIKVIDFGQSCQFTKGAYLSERAGTFWYVAPEVLRRKYDHKADVWSCGVLMYVLLSGKPPFYGNNELQTFAMIESGKFDFPKYEWNHISKFAKDLIKTFLAFEPASRLECEEALLHCWFSRQLGWIACKSF